MNQNSNSEIFVYTKEGLREWSRSNWYKNTNGMDRDYTYEGEEFNLIFLRIEDFLKNEKHISIAETATNELLSIDLTDEFIFLKWCWKYRSLGEEMMDFGIEHILGSEHIDNQIITISDKFYCDAKPFKNMIFIFYIYLELSGDTTLSKETIANVQKLIAEYNDGCNTIYK